MRYLRLVFLVVVLSLVVAGCATVKKAPVAIEAPVSQDVQRAAQKIANAPERPILKRKVAIVRFTNETRYGKTFLRDSDLDPLGKQVSDMLTARLVESNRFMVFERQDLAKIEQEQQIIGQASLVGVDTIILGSLTEFGRSTTGTRGFLSATKKQIARAKVEIRMVDPKTAHAFFTASGTGEASSEAGEVAGWGSQADYDATLNDRAIGAAISDVLSSLVAKLEERPWRTSVLKVDGTRVFISGGKSQGLRVDDVFGVFREGEQVTSEQTGFKLRLPAEKIASIRLVSFFGDDEWREGAVASVIDGSLAGYEQGDLFVAEQEREQL